MTARVQGYGCMGLSAFYVSGQSTSEEKAVQVLQHAWEKGVRTFNSATFYGELNEVGYGANLRLLSKFIATIDRSQLNLVVKIGMDTRAEVAKTGTVWNIRGDYQGLSDDVDYALQQLKTDYIDVIVLCRVSPTVPIEESVAALRKIVESGRAKYIGLSEASLSTLQRASSISKIDYIEQEWSLWSRDIEDEGIVEFAKENDVKILAYSPLGRGFLTARFQDRQDFDPNDYRLNHQPKMSADNFYKNLELVNAVKKIAEGKNVTTGQIALAWLYAKLPSVIPIPGTSSPHHLDQNLEAMDIVLTEDEVNTLETIFSPANVKGDRYPYAGLTFKGNKP